MELCSRFQWYSVTYTTLTHRIPARTMTNTWNNPNPVWSITSSTTNFVVSSESFSQVERGKLCLLCTTSTCRCNPAPAPPHGPDFCLLMLSHYLPIPNVSLHFNKQYIFKLIYLMWMLIRPVDTYCNLIWRIEFGSCYWLNNIEYECLLFTVVSIKGVHFRTWWWVTNIFFFSWPTTMGDR